MVCLTLFNFYIQVLLFVGKSASMRTLKYHLGSLYEHQTHALAMVKRNLQRLKAINQFFLQNLLFQNSELDSCIY
jgi:hypothetical protein